MVGSTKAMIGTFEDWTWPAFVPLFSIACGAIPFAAILRSRHKRVDNWSRLLLQSVIVSVVALIVSGVLAMVVFDIVRSSWQYAHDGVADWFILSIPATTALVVVGSGVFRKDMPTTTAPQHEY
jgi:O-antigen/teichoic acid export membrane protein